MLLPCLPSSLFPLPIFAYTGFPSVPALHLGGFKAYRLPRNVAFPFQSSLF